MTTVRHPNPPRPAQLRGDVLTNLHQRALRLYMSTTQFVQPLNVLRKLA